jgi:hypothetical protein
MILHNNLHNLTTPKFKWSSKKTAPLPVISPAVDLHAREPYHKLPL